MAKKKDDAKKKKEAALMAKKAKASDMNVEIIKLDAMLKNRVKIYNTLLNEIYGPGK